MSRDALRNVNNAENNRQFPLNCVEFSFTHGKKYKKIRIVEDSPTLYHQKMTKLVQFSIEEFIQKQS
jgi:hypothetical protein